MNIIDLKLYTVKSGDTGARGAAQGESQYWGGGWQAQKLISNPITDIQPIFSVLEGGPLPVNGKISLDPHKPGFGVELIPIRFQDETKARRILDRWRDASEAHIRSDLQRASNKADGSKDQRMSLILKANWN
jgi:hypothetical protein